MPTFVMLSRSVPGSFGSAGDFKETSAKVRKTIETEVPQARWICSYALAGRYDALDVFEAPDMQQAIAVSTIVRTIAKAETETMFAEEWGAFVKKVASPKS